MLLKQTNNNIWVSCINPRGSSSCKHYYQIYWVKFRENTKPKEILFAIDSAHLEHSAALSKFPLTNYRIRVSPTITSHRFIKLGSDAGPARSSLINSVDVRDTIRQRYRKIESSAKGKNKINFWKRDNNG